MWHETNSDHAVIFTSEVTNQLFLLVTSDGQTGSRNLEVFYINVDYLINQDVLRMEIIHSLYWASAGTIME